MTPENLEAVWLALGQALTEVRPDDAALYLARLALLLALDVGDVDAVLRAIERARADLPAATEATT